LFQKYLKTRPWRCFNPVAPIASLRMHKKKKKPLAVAWLHAKKGKVRTRARKRSAGTKVDLFVKNVEW